MSDREEEFVYIPRIWDVNGESEIFRRCHLFLELASTLVYFRPTQVGPTLTYTRQKVLYQLMKLKPCVVPEVQQLYDMVQEAALAYKIGKAELKGATHPDEQLFPKELLEHWLSRKVKLKNYIKEHKAVVKKILKLQKYFYTHYSSNEYLWNRIQYIPDEETSRIIRSEKKLLMYKEAVSRETKLKSKICSDSCGLKTEIEVTLRNTIAEGIANLKLVAGYKCPDLNLGEICAKIYAATSQKYFFIDPTIQVSDPARKFLPKVLATKVKPSDFARLTAEAMRTKKSNNPLPKIVYVTYWGQIRGPNEKEKFPCDRPVKQKIISTEAGKGFGWTKRSMFSSKEWVIYYLEIAPNPDLI
ncbi:hypothetical protein ACJMK2_030876 [Sinanodonta woodiana]|uniref:Uncharacterized protein n=1 Tax=Sinanodonta woodiana TaxID=1069815 RepID=A0ABD3WYH3_SINWO